MELINYLMEPCDRISYGKKLDEVSEKLNCSRRTVQRMVKKWEEGGNNGLSSSQRADKGQHRIDSVLVDFIKKQYIEANRGGSKVNRSQIAVKAQVKAL
ncbi:helix-turn-helix domain-containing protein [Cyanobacterium sp. Dongsha4]|nr:helix-turn-helix domain-containing protein [Cyanobacterium sp. Dongsha4]